MALGQAQAHNLRYFLDLAASDDVGALAELARNLGHELPEQNQDYLAAFWAGLADLRARERSDYARGFIAALDLLMGAFVAQTNSEVELAESVRIAKSRQPWKKVLLALKEGHGRPSEIASSTRLPLSTVSRTLSELEEHRLVERVGPIQGEDGRSRPVRLLPAGEPIAEQLAKGDAESPAAAVLPAAVAIFSSLICQQRITRGDVDSLIARSIGRAAAGSVSKRFIQLSIQGGLVSDINGILVAMGSGLTDTLREMINDALHGKPEPFDMMMESLSTDAPVWLRCGDLRSQWDVISSRRPDLRLRTINWADVKIDDVSPPAGEKYVVLYENSALLHGDLTNSKIGFSSLIERAEKRFCFGTEGSTLPSNFNLITVTVSP